MSFIVTGAVIEAFIRLHEKDLIYQGLNIFLLLDNWCISCLLYVLFFTLILYTNNTLMQILQYSILLKVAGNEVIVQ